MQSVTEKIEQHKDIIDANNKSFYEMKKAKDAKQNERKYVTVSVIISLLSFCAALLCVLSVVPVVADFKQNFLTCDV